MKAAIVTTLLAACAALPILGGTDALAAGRKVILLTSVDGVAMAHATPALLFWLKSRYLNMNQRLENDVREHFRGTGVEVEALHYADPSILYRVLHSPEYAVVYWVSHGADPKGSTPTQNGAFYDYQTFDVSPVFEQINPNLRLLALISCFSKENLARLRYEDEEFDAKHPGLTFLSFSGEVEEETGLRRALTTSDALLAPFIEENRNTSCSEKRHGIFVSLSRKCRENGPAMFVKGNGHLVTTFPRCQAGELQHESGYVELGSDDVRDMESGSFDPSILDITISAGAQPIDRVMFASKPEFGEIEISHLGASGQNFSWQLLRQSSGAPSGIDRRIYAYRGDVPRDFNVGEFSPYFCHALETP